MNSFSLLAPDPVVSRNIVPIKRRASPAFNYDRTGKIKKKRKYSSSWEYLGDVQPKIMQFLTTRDLGRLLLLTSPSLWKPYYESDSSKLESSRAPPKVWEELCSSRWGHENATQVLWETGICAELYFRAHAFPDPDYPIRKREHQQMSLRCLKYAPCDYVMTVEVQRSRDGKVITMQSFLGETIPEFLETGKTDVSMHGGPVDVKPISLDILDGIIARTSSDEFEIIVRLVRYPDRKFVQLLRCRWISMNPRHDWKKIKKIDASGVWTSGETWIKGLWSGGGAAASGSRTKYQRYLMRQAGCKGADEMELILHLGIDCRFAPSGPVDRFTRIQKGKMRLFGFHLSMVLVPTSEQNGTSLDLHDRTRDYQFAHFLEAMDGWKDLDV